jgi:hypothetical protein
MDSKEKEGKDILSKYGINPPKSEEPYVFKGQQGGKKPVRVSFTQELEDILNHIADNNNYIAFELVGMAEADAKYHNGLNIGLVGVSKKDWHFDVAINGKRESMKVGKFIRYFIGNESIISQDEIRKFTEIYNKLKNDEPQADEQHYDPIPVPEFKYNPLDVRATFISLTTKTYPHGHEEEVLQFLPELKKDEVDNYYLQIGKSETMFTSHLDTADRKQMKTTLYDAEEKGDSYIITGGDTILGADDKAGVTIMLYMIENKVPGLYYFFVGEEVGGIGSGNLANIFDKVDHLKGIKRCVSFDRRNYHSVITEQLGRRCCSDEFATALCKEYNKSGEVKLSLDPTGIYTDSASFTDDIPECTNISVGYMHEHTVDEYQNITFLEKIAKASVSVNWESLPTARKVGIDEFILNKYRNVISGIKNGKYNLEAKVYGYDGSVFIRVNMDETDVEDIHSDLAKISSLFKVNKLGDPDIEFMDTYLKIHLK